MSNTFKKILGIILIVLCSFLILFSLAGFILNMLDPDGENFYHRIYTPLFFGLLCCVGLYYGIKLYKAGKNRVIEKLPLEPNESLEVEVKITLAEYRHFLFFESYTRPAMLYFTFIATGSLLAVFFYKSDDYFIQLLMPVAIFVFLPISLLFQSSKNYNGTPVFKEKTTYHFDLEKIRATSASSDATIKWSGLSKIRETKKFFLLYTSTLTAYFISKNSFKSAEDLQKFKAFISNADGVKRELR